MNVFRPDFARRIDLLGAGPCPRPVDIDRSVTGFSRLVALRVYSFAQGMTIDGEAEDDEVFIVVMGGQADIAIAVGPDHDTFALRHQGGKRAVYMPPHASYRLDALTDCDIAYARAQPVGARSAKACAFEPDMGRMDIAGYASGMDLSLFAPQSGAIMQDPVAPERFVHVRGGHATVDGEALDDWDSAALDQGDPGLLNLAPGTAEILIISASHGE